MTRISLSSLLAPRARARDQARAWQVLKVMNRAVGDEDDESGAERHRGSVQRVRVFLKSIHPETTSAAIVVNRGSAGCSRASSRTAR